MLILDNKLIMTMFDVFAFFCLIVKLEIDVHGSTWIEVGLSFIV